MPVRARSCAAERRRVGTGPGPPAGSPALVRTISARVDRSAVLEVHTALARTDRTRRPRADAADRPLKSLRAAARSSKRYSEISSSWMTMPASLVVVQRPTVEEKSHAPGLPRARAEEVDAHEASGGDHEAALLAHLARRQASHGVSPLSSICPAGHGPSALVGRLQDQETPGAGRRSGPPPTQGSSGSRRPSRHGRRRRKPPAEVPAWRPRRQGSLLNRRGDSP